MRGRELRTNLSRLHLGHDRVLLDPFQVVGNPLDQPMAATAKFIGVHGAPLLLTKLAAGVWQTSGVSHGRLRLFPRSGIRPVRSRRVGPYSR